MLLNLKQHDQQEPVNFKIKVSTRKTLLKTKYTTILRMNWASKMELSRDFSEKTISLPGYVTHVTVDTLNIMKNYTINLHWIPNMLNRGSFTPSDVSLCNKDLLPTTIYTYCLNYTSAQKSYIFFWNIYRYHKKYEFYNMYSQLAYIQKTSDRRDHDMTNKKQVAKSWIEASDLCKSIGGFLPIIRNRDELDELITFIRSSEDMPPVEALYIGLRRQFEPQVTF